MIELYVMETCPYCNKVRKFFDENGVNYEKKDVSNSKNHQELMEIGGIDQVPFLKDDKIQMYESDDIIAYAKEKYCK